MKRILTFVESVREATFQSMSFDKDVILFGLGVDDPKEIFGTTKGLKKKFGASRVFDVPTSENALTGIGVGASINGKKVIMVHQRLDFFLLAMDQLVNSAAKWYFMFGQQKSIPITIRLILGRGWGQGPTHSQNLHAWFAHIPGLKVVMPSSAQDAKGLLISSIFDKNPVIFLEHRWLHNSQSYVKRKFSSIPLGKANVVRSGKDITIVAISYMVVEAIEASKTLEKLGISCEIIDPRTISPFDYDAVIASVKKTNNLLVLDTGHKFGSISAEIMSTVIEKCWGLFKKKPSRLASPDFPEATSYNLTKDYHVRSEHIINKVLDILEIKDKKFLPSRKKSHHDIPGAWFKGPF